MDTVRILLGADFRAVRSWFQTHTFSRFVVAFLFFGIFAGISSGIFAVSGMFFRMLVAYEAYGRLTADYIVHASVLVLLLLAVGSAVVSAIGSAISQNADMAYLLTCPIPRRYFAIWLLLKAAVADMMLLVFVCVPIIVSYASAFSLWTFGFFLRSILALVCIGGIATSVGTVIAVLLMRNFSGREYVLAGVGFAVFFSGMVAVLRMIFPPQMSRLFDAASGEFMTLFQELPLNSSILPTSWIAEIITEGQMGSLAYALACTVGVMLLSYAYLRDSLVRILKTVRSHAQTPLATARWGRLLLSTRMPIVGKDILSILRVPSETGYGAFLLSIAAFFFLSVSFGTRSLMRYAEWQRQFIEFSYAWLLFFATAYFLRFSFPLMSREGKTIWFLNTQPSSPGAVVRSKAAFSMLAAVPMAAMSVAVWLVLPFSEGYRGPLSVLSVIAVMTVALLQAYIGCIAPDYRAASSPDRISTSGAGFAALAVSALVAVGWGWTIRSIITGELSAYYAIPGIIAVSGYVLLLLYGAAIRAVRIPKP